MWTTSLPVTFLLFAISTMVAAQPGGESERDRPPPEPLRTASCLVEGKFSCWTFEYTYSVRGLACTEDCLALSSLNHCALNNRCHWNQDSGCFVKDVCLEISAMNTCRRWESHPICP